MRLGDKLIQLRRERGYSQEQLAQLLNVSRQSVSKWESGQSTPEISKLITIADIFNVNVDSLVRDERELPDLENRKGQSESSMQETSPAMTNSDRVYRYGFYEYKSKTRIFGIPLVHIKSGYGIQVAKGIIAIGNISIGFISIGGISVGALSLGGIGLGLLVLAGMALGGIAFGGFAIGILAMGGMAVGIYSAGGMAIASKLAIGGAAFGHTAIGVSPRGVNILDVTDAIRYDQIRDFIIEYHPKIWRPFLRILAFFGELVSLG